MNIAILIPELGGGGAERVASILGDYYYDKGHKVYYFLEDREVKQRYQVKGQIINSQVRLDISDDENLISAFAKLLGYSINMRKLKRKYKIHVAVSFMEWFNYLNILSKGKEKVIISVRTILSERKEITLKLFQPKWIGFFYRFAHKVVVPSNYAKQDLCKHYGIKKTKINTIPNPSIRQNNQPDIEEWIYGDEAVICVGRLEAVKQQERIIRAFSTVHEQNKRARLLILGEGPNRSYLGNICRECGVEDAVSFLGFKKNVGYYLQHSKIFVMASITEGFPNSMVEAMAYGLPVISTDSPGGCRDILGKESVDDKAVQIQYEKYGILTPYISGKLKPGMIVDEKERMLGNAMKELLNNPLLYQKYQARSLKRASMYSMERIMRRWDKLIIM